jgi:hypothetical protein
LLVEEGERAALDFQRKDFEIVQQDRVRDPSPTNRAVSICCRMFSDVRVGSRGSGGISRASLLFLQQRTFVEARDTSALCQQRTTALLFAISSLS